MKRLLVGLVAVAGLAVAAPVCAQRGPTNHLNARGPGNHANARGPSNHTEARGPGRHRHYAPTPYYYAPYYQHYYQPRVVLVPPYVAYTTPSPYATYGTCYSQDSTGALIGLVIGALVGNEIGGNSGAVVGGVVGTFIGNDFYDGYGRFICRR